MKIKDIMGSPYFTDDNIELSEAAKIMSSNKIPTLIYMEKEKVAGIVTESDLLKNFSKNKKIKDIMSENVITIDQDGELEEAILLMQENKIKRLPVLQKDKLVGIISLSDIAAHSDEIDEGFFFE